VTSLRWMLLIGALIAAIILAVAIGTINIPLSDIWAALWATHDTVPSMIVRQLRLPRVCLAMLVGAGLGMSGAALQGAMRNPLAEPYLLGVSGGAAVGAVVASAVGIAAALLPVAAFAGAIIAVAAAIAMARAAGARGDSRMLLMCWRTPSRTSFAMRCGG
jgi:iron complex transport system permease protein